MKVHNEFDVPLPPAEAWKTLCDIEAIVPCLPGAAITEKVDEGVYRGHIAVKLGPVALRLRGTAQFTAMDHARRRATVQAQAQDDKARGGVNSAMHFHLEPAADGSRVFVDTDLKLSGPIAQYGRASGIVEQLAERIVSDFADCLRTRLDAAPVPAGRHGVDGAGRARRGPPIPAIALLLRVLGGRVSRLASRIFRRS